MKRILKTSFIVVAFLAVIAGLVFAEFFFGFAPLDESRIRADVSLPQLTGRYPVGRRFLNWMDQSRSDPFRKSARRELAVSVWYPALRTDSEQMGTYLPGGRGLLIARFQSMMMRLRVQSFWSALLHNPLPRDLLTGIKTHAVENQVVSSDEPNFPVLLFSPGFGAMVTEYTAILEDIASHGYIVVAIIPTDFVPTMLENG